VSAELSPALARHVRAERVTRIRRLKRHLAYFLSLGIEPVALVGLMVELMTLQEEHHKEPHT